MKALTKRLVEKPWGKDILPSPFLAPEGKRIGEVWFEPPVEMPDILVKYIFTSEKLSVQVHPSDAQARELGEADRGKEECWLVIDAEPGATLGVGFRESVDAATMRAAALDGSIEDMLAWHPVQAGDFFYIPAGTVHAIGAGVSLIEVQQNSDITYRLYDYGRPRELHLDKGLQVAKGKPHDPALRRNGCLGTTQRLAQGEYFVADAVAGIPSAALRAEYQGPCLVIPLRNNIGLGDIVLEPGDCGLAAGANVINFDPAGNCLLVRPF